MAACSATHRAMRANFKTVLNCTPHTPFLFFGIKCSQLIRVERVGGGISRSGVGQRTEGFGLGDRIGNRGRALHGGSILRNRGRRLRNRVLFEELLGIALIGAGLGWSVLDHEVDKENDKHGDSNDGGNDNGIDLKRLSVNVDDGFVSGSDSPAVNKKPVSVDSVRRASLKRNVIGIGSDTKGAGGRGRV